MARVSLEVLQQGGAMLTARQTTTTVGRAGADLNIELLSAIYCPRLRISTLLSP